MLRVSRLRNIRDRQVARWGKNVWALRAEAGPLGAAEERV